VLLVVVSYGEEDGVRSYVDGRDALAVRAHLLTEVSSFRFSPRSSE
jgi:hypothetical protein